jgi:hypothetical protein
MAVPDGVDLKGEIFQISYYQYHHPPGGANPIMIRKVSRFFFSDYIPSIHFPDRHKTELAYSGKKIKMTNRDALNHALS